MVDKKEIGYTQSNKNNKTTANNNPNYISSKKPPDNTTKKSGHHKSYSAVDEEFAFNPNEKNDYFEIQLEHFMNNYDELIYELKNTVKETKMNKNNSDPNKINQENSSKGSMKPKKTHSASMNFDNMNNKNTESNDNKSTNFTDESSKKAKSKRGSKVKKKNIEEINDLVAQVDKKIDIKQLTSIEEIKDYYEYTENCLRVIAKLTVPDEKEIEHLKFELPEKFTKKKLAVFDLDETLIHCELKEPQKAEKLITITLPNMKKARVSKLSF